MPIGEPLPAEGPSSRRFAGQEHVFLLNAPNLLLALIAAGLATYGTHVLNTLRQEAFDLHFANDALQPVARAERLLLAAAQAFHLASRNDAPVCRVALDADATLPVPAPQRVEADPERTRSLAGGVRPGHRVATVLHRHYIGKLFAITLLQPGCAENER